MPQQGPHAAPARNATAALVLADGTVYWGYGFGATGRKVGEVCFNTSITGYQEILTDPSYAGQIITFTFPHIGNVGANSEDIETTTPAARGLVVRERVTGPSSFRSQERLDTWLARHGLVGIAGLDTRGLVRRVRSRGFQNGAIEHGPAGSIDTEALLAEARAWPGLEGMDLAGEVTCRQSYAWDETSWRLGHGYGRLTEPRRHVVALDYGAKRNILRCLADMGCRVTVLPASATTEDVLARKPDGVFLSNGPGDPAATGLYAVPTIKGVIDRGLPVFGICLGHQMLALALGANTRKMACGHRGANHPVKDLATGGIEITSQNHGFAVVAPDGGRQVDADRPVRWSTDFGEAILSHVNLYDRTVEGLTLLDVPGGTVQYHPEAGPGPHDSLYLFDRFLETIRAAA